jgi:3-deoxy-D-manno-octulosonate 8-phosphate phosphatase (KDO 8-P phosphatase)
MIYRHYLKTWPHYGNFAVHNLLSVNSEILANFELDPVFPYERAAGIKLLALDVDGILTDGGIYYNADGLFAKRFDCHDGVAIKLAQSANITIALISGMESAAVEQRAKVLGIEEVYCGIFDKLATITELKQKYQLEWSQIAFVGDDWVDLPVLRVVGLALTVKNAQPEVRGLVHYVSRYGGGHGALRHLLRHILAAQSKLEDLLRIWLTK